MRTPRHPGRLASGCGALLVALLLVAGSTISPAHAAPADREARFVELINEARTARAMPKLRNDPELYRVAVSWTRRMAAAGRLSHNANLRNDFRGPWAKLGENVGRGGTPDDIQRAFESSPAHLRNIIDPDFDSMAVAVVEIGDMIYVTEQFRWSGLPSQNVPDVFMSESPSSLGPVATLPASTVALAVVTVARRPGSGPPTSISVVSDRSTR